MIELDALEARILGCLIEKEATVADNYPLTLNSLKLACNQKSARHPVMNIADGELLRCAHLLADKSYILVEDNFGKIEKYRHRFGRILEIDKPGLSVIAILLLRGEQTLNEIYTRSKRIFAFDSQSQAYEELLKLIENEWVVKLPKRAGTKEHRYMHQLCGKIDINEAELNTPQLTPLEEKVATLEARVDDLQDLIDELMEKI
ncbi:Virulence factor mviM [uncultured Candidatus Thioglobus sp.]|nr:Virulence factor mviM [uncultured Candidatus Thioglobus sp.]